MRVRVLSANPLIAHPKDEELTTSQLTSGTGQVVSVVPTLNIQLGFPHSAVRKEIRCIAHWN